MEFLGWRRDHEFEVVGRLGVEGLFGHVSWNSLLYMDDGNLFQSIVLKSSSKSIQQRHSPLLPPFRRGSIHRTTCTARRRRRFIQPPS